MNKWNDAEYRKIVLTKFVELTPKKPLPQFSHLTTTFSENSFSKFRTVPKTVISKNLLKELQKFYFHPFNGINHLNPLNSAKNHKNQFLFIHFLSKKILKSSWDKRVLLVRGELTARKHLCAV